MKFSSSDVARLIDISAVQAYHGEKEIRELVGNAVKYNFIAVHVLPCWVSFLAGLLSEHKGILVGAPVGFPGGAHKTETKVFEARQLCADGVNEADMMLNIGKLKSGGFAYVEEDIKAVVEAARPIPIKVILETHYLTEDEIKKACELCIKAKAEYVKTSTGWAPSGATLEVIKLITGFVGNSIKVKAAGGIRNLKSLVEMYGMGVSRFGINLKASIDIVNEVDALPGKIVEV